MFERQNFLFVVVISLAVLAATEDFRLAGVAFVLALVGMGLYISPSTGPTGKAIMQFLGTLIPQRKGQKNKVVWKPLTAILYHEVRQNHLSPFVPVQLNPLSLPV